jgi:hypothetical protein
MSNKLNEERLRDDLIARALENPYEVQYFRVKNTEKLVDGNVVKTNEFRIGFARKGNKR